MSDNKAWNDACIQYCKMHNLVLIEIYSNYFEYEDAQGFMYQMYSRELAEKLFR